MTTTEPPDAWDTDPGPPLCAICHAPNLNGCQLCGHCGSLPCRHGNPPGNCAECDAAGDLAFDAARERGGR